MSSWADLRFGLAEAFFVFIAVAVFFFFLAATLLSLSAPATTIFTEDLLFLDLACIHDEFDGHLFLESEFQIFLVVRRLKPVLIPDDLHEYK